jgi:hypothetical protein
MQDTFEKEGSSSAGSIQPATEAAAPGETVIREPVDEYGLVLLETRIAADGTKRTRKVTRKGWPVLTAEEAALIDIEHPYDPDL